ncbi:GNAT family N-acetyltransferase [Pacificimonas sp. WHA3]|uniref:GNAT family N-acetyltransferase n=1 Tax=Pacificimonas pallii TaxID=2827236 RepID=A0ABS6SD90_9SPHN|nr:GNAT family N-acetyltransferase [Pacificimonas pallii]MBV7255812.1 GNAT family N-acetyltransferase [Pacificimonas pallii]
MHDTDITVRTAEITDAGRLSLIGQATFLESFADILPGSDILLHCRTQHSAADYAARLASDDGALWLAEGKRGAPIGYAALSTPDLPDVESQPGDVELKRIYVLSRFHGSGVGMNLMNTTIAHAKEVGCRRLLLGVYARNGRAINFYRKSGFALIGSRRFLVGENRYDDVIMARSLDEGADREG